VCFDGWLESPSIACAKDFGVAVPQTWLLRIGWREHDLLRLDAVPGPLELQRIIERRGQRTSAD